LSRDPDDAHALERTLLGFVFAPTIADVGLSAAACDRFVPQYQSRIEQRRILNGSEKPFSLTDERFIASAIPFPQLHIDAWFETADR